MVPSASLSCLDMGQFYPQLAGFLHNDKFVNYHEPGFEVCHRAVCYRGPSLVTSSLVVRREIAATRKSARAPKKQRGQMVLFTGLLPSFLLNEVR